MRKRKLGSKYPNTLISINEVAVALKDQGKYTEAESINRETLARREKVLRREHPDTLTSINNLALVLRR